MHRYQDIATRAFAVLQKQASSNAQQSATNNLRYKPQPLNQFIASQVYAVLLITVFMVQVSAVQYVPYIGILNSLAQMSVTIFANVKHYSTGVITT